LAEKLAEAEDTHPVETPDDVAAQGAEVVDASASHGAPGRGDTSDTDAIVRAAKAMRDGSPTEGAQAQAKACLIVDDSRVIRKVATKIAKSLGYVPLEAQDGIEALARCKKAMPALVLTDWNMPEMDGLEFVRQLRAIPTPKPPVIVFCTSKGDATDIHEGIKAGADDYIVKPFDEAALKAKLEQLGRG